MLILAECLSHMNLVNGLTQYKSPWFKLSGQITWPLSWSSWFQMLLRLRCLPFSLVPDIVKIFHLSWFLSTIILWISLCMSISQTDSPIMLTIPFSSVFITSLCDYVHVLINIVRWKWDFGMVLSWSYMEH